MINVIVVKEFMAMVMAFMRYGYVTNVADSQVRQVKIKNLEYWQTIIQK